MSAGFVGNLWNGSLKDLIEKVEANEMSLKGEKVEVESVPRPEAAYLGPKLWEKPISLQQFNEDDFFVMNIDDFLAENDLQKEKFGNALKENETSPEPESMRFASLAEITKKQPDSPPSSVITGVGSHSPLHVPSPRPGVIMSTKDSMKKNLLPKGENNFLYAESKRAKMEREKEEKRRRMEVDMEFAPEDLALATVPGADFNPRERAFDVEELRPQPIIRKRPKLFVPEMEKDDRYWDKRCKNNVAARRSREARRLKENQIALRAAYLEKENAMLKADLDEATFERTKLAMERDILMKKLAKYE